jgi:hypothetical protein
MSKQKCMSYRFLCQAERPKQVVAKTPAKSVARNDLSPWREPHDEAHLSSSATWLALLEMAAFRLSVLLIDQQREAR